MSHRLDEFWKVTIEAESIVWCTRSPKPYLSLFALDEALVLLNHRLSEFDRSAHSLLLDLRRGSRSNHGEWTAGALLHHRRRLIRGFRGAGLLVLSPDQAEPIPRPLDPEHPEVQLFRDPDRARGALRLPRVGKNAMPA